VGQGIDGESVTLDEKNASRGGGKDLREKKRRLSFFEGEDCWPQDVLHACATQTGKGIKAGDEGLSQLQATGTLRTTQVRKSQ